MPLVEPPKDCKGCGACCHELIVELEHGEEVPDFALAERGNEGRWQMKRRDDGSCVALDRATMLCTIYENRPNVCRQFGPEDNTACLDRVYNRQQIVMDAAAQRVETVLKAAADFVLACGYAPTMVSKFKDGKTNVKVLFQPTITGPDVRREVLGESLARIQEAISVEALLGKVEGA